jgi:hypothetical protein
MDTPDPIAPFRPCHVPSVDASPWLCGSGTSGYYETGRYKNYSPYSFDTAEAEFLEAQHKGYHPIYISAPYYSVFLAETSDAPPLLWANGNIACLNKPIIAPVGAHSASSLRRRVIHMMVEGLAEVDFSMISRLAHSIDAAATLKHGTIAVVASGLDVFYRRAKCHNILWILNYRVELNVNWAACLHWPVSGQKASVPTQKAA